MLPSISETIICNHFNKLFTNELQVVCFFTSTEFVISSKKYNIKIFIPDYKRDTVSARAHIEREIIKVASHLLI